MMKCSQVFIQVFILFAFLVIGCSDERTGPARQQNPYSGYSHTGSANPDIIGVEDTNDWKPIAEIGFKPFPVYPNPTYGNQTTFQFQITDNTFNYKIYTHDWETDKTNQLVNDNLNIGVHSITVQIDTSLRAERFIRLFVEATEGNNSYTTSGDILFKP